MSLSAATPRQSHIPEWLRGAWGVALLFTGIYVLLYAAFSLVQFGGGEMGAALANIAYLPVGLAATIFAWRIAASQRYDHRLRQAWLLIGLGIFSQFAGDVSWLVMESILGIEPYPSIADVFYLGTYPFLMWGLLSLPMQKAKALEQARFLFDALIAIVSGGLLMWFFLIRPAVEAAEGDVLSAIVGASYPIGDLILLIGVVVLSYRHSDARISGSVKYLGLGVVLFLAADVIYAFIADEYVSGMWLDDLWLGAFLMFSTAAVYQAQVSSQSLSQGWAQRIERAMRVVITLISFASYVWMIFALSTQETDSLTQIMLLGSGLALSALLVSRQWLTVRENQALLKQSLADRSAVEELSQSLEQRVAERTNELLVAADVVRRVSVVRDIDQLLLDAVNTIAERFNLYYVQIYLLDEQAGALVLKAGSGAVGNILRQKGHRLALASSSLNATAAQEKRSVLVADTRKSDTFRANPLLPETRCELSVPLIFQQRVLGVLDIQGSQPSGLNQEKVPVFEALAGQLAISIENSNLHAWSSAAMQRAEEQAALLTRAGWRAFLDGIHRSERLGYLAEGERVEPADDLPEAEPEVSSMQEPIIIAGQTIGWLQIEGEQVDAPHVRELVNWAAEQTAQKLENLRLLAQAEQYRQEAEQVVQRLTREGWQSYQDSLREGQIGYVYDQQRVASLAAGSNGYHERAVLLPLQLHEEQIGELGVVSASELDEEDRELMETIAGQLSTHLENLRLLEETRRAESELATRAAEMVKVAELATQVTTQTEVAELLQSLVDQTKESFGLYHAHIYLMEEKGEHLNLAAGAGEVGRTMVMTGWQISAASEKSLVARAARTRQAVIVNDVRADPEFLPNELLPETRSEMAVPLVVGNRVLGVLDVQSDEVEHFSSEDASIQTTLASQVAVALQNAQQYRETQAALKESETLYAITSAATHSMELSEILTETLSRLLAATGYEAGLVSMVDENSGKLYLAVHHNLPEMLHKWLKSHGMAGTLCQFVFDTGKAIILNDLVDGAPVDVSGMLKMGFRSYQGAPVMAKGKVLGTICVFGYTARSDEGTPTTLFQAAGQQIGIAIENTRLFQETQSALAKSETLYAITRTATRSLDLNEILNEMLVQVLRATNLDMGLISMVDPASGELALAVHHRMPEPLVRKLTTQGLKGTLCALVYEQQKAVSINNLETDSPIDASGLLGLGLRAYQGVPLEARGQVLGTLCAFSLTSQSDLSQTLELMQIVGQQVGIAIENAQLFQRTQQQAEREASINTISQRIQATTSVEEALQVAVRELGRTLGAQRATIQLGVPQREPHMERAASGNGSSGSNDAGKNGH